MFAVFDFSPMQRYNHPMKITIKNGKKKVEYTEEPIPSDPPGNPARGCIIGVLASIPLWALIVFILWLAWPK